MFNLIKKIKKIPKFLELVFKYVKLESIVDVFISKIFWIPRQIKFKDGSEAFFSITYSHLPALPSKKNLVDEKYKIYCWEIAGRKFYSTIEQVSSITLLAITKDIDVYYAADYKNKKVLDVGGHIGDSAMYFLDKGAAFVDIYEPVEQNIISMKLNLANYPKEKYKINQLAVCNKEGELSFTTLDFPGSPSFGSSFFLKPLAEFFKPKVEKYSFSCVSFKKILTENHYDIAKIDCEGCEKYLLELDQKTLTKIPIWLIEVHSKELEKNILEKFKQAGFKSTTMEKSIPDLGTYKFELI
ncbi:MAG: FkbM family methyltransferase [Candidatus Micrarchaeota archaeon]|nr:FkbM family methyltransferase [Candidatus Micrarchaeota archaeon]